MCVTSPPKYINIYYARPRGRWRVGHLRGALTGSPPLSVRNRLMSSILGGVLVLSSTGCVGCPVDMDGVPPRGALHDLIGFFRVFFFFLVARADSSQLDPALINIAEKTPRDPFHATAYSTLPLPTPHQIRDDSCYSNTRH